MSRVKCSREQLWLYHHLYLLAVPTAVKRHCWLCQRAIKAEVSQGGSLCIMKHCILHQGALSVCKGGASMTTGGEQCVLVCFGLNAHRKDPQAKGKKDQINQQDA